MLPELEMLYTYKNDAVLERYARHYPRAKLSAETAFKELMKYMWLALKAQADNKKFICAIHEEMHEIDNMWHTFLLFTRDYQAFCEKYLGNFFHHTPIDKNENLLSDTQYETELTDYLTYIYDHLGAETVKTWFLNK